MGFKEAIDYLVEELGFVKVSVNNARDIIDTDVGFGEDEEECHILINFERKTIIKWMFEDEVEILIGNGLIEGEERRLWELQK